MVTIRKYNNNKKLTYKLEIQPLLGYEWSYVITNKLKTNSFSIKTNS